MPRGSPPSAHQLSTLPCILLRRRGLARAQSSPRTVLGVGGVDIILETKSRLSQEVRGREQWLSLGSTDCEFYNPICEPHIHAAQCAARPSFYREGHRIKQSICSRVTKLGSESKHILTRKIRL